MKKVLLITTITIIVITAVCSAQEIESSIVTSFPSPGPSPQGLAWDGTYLWASDDSTDTIYKIEPSDGTILNSFYFPNAAPKGLTWDGENLWCVLGGTNTMNKLDPESGEILQTLGAVYESSLSDSSIHIHGLAWDGSNLLCSYYAGYSSAVISVNVNDGTGNDWFYCMAEDMTYDGTYFWNVGLSRQSNGTYKGSVTKRNLTTGSIITLFRTPDSYPTGLTWDGTCFWVADRGTDIIYQIELLPTMVESESTPIPFTVQQNYPNPFNPSTTLSYSLARPSHTTLDVFNAIGQKVASLVDSYMSAGNHSVVFDGNGLATGMYFYLFSADGVQKSGRMTLVK